MTGQCIVFTQPRRAELGTITVPDPGPGQIVTRTLYTGVSTGTETRVFRGGQHEAAFPLIPGYENVGEVIAVGPETTLKVGTTVFVRGHQYDTHGRGITWGSQVSHSLAAESAVVPVPSEVNAEGAVFGKVSGISLHGVKRGRVAADEWVVVVGLGLIGHFVVQHAAARGAHVIAADMADDRLAMAKAGGAEHTVNVATQDLAEEVARLTDGGADVCFDATGRADTANASAQVLRHRPWDSDPAAAARLVIQGSLEAPLCLDYYDGFFDPEIDVIATRDNDTQDLIDSLDLMASGKIDPTVITVTEYDPANAQEAYERLDRREIMRVRFSWASR